MSKQSELIIYWKQLGDLLLMEPALTKLTLIIGLFRLESTVRVAFE